MSPQTPSYSLRQEADRILRDVLLRDPRLHLPQKVVDAASRTSFSAHAALDTPYLPVPLKFTESSAALWALAATIGNAIVAERFDVTQNVEVNTDVASLFLASPAIARVDGKTVSDPELAARLQRYDIGRMGQPWRRLATNVYPTRDGRWFHLHGSMNADRSLTMVGLPKENPSVTTMEDIIKTYCDSLRNFDSRWLEVEANEHWRQAGVTCLTEAEFRASPHGKATLADGLYLLDKTDAELPPAPYPSVVGKRRPLEGLRMLDLSRVIAAPTVAKLAALFGATVVRVSFDGQPDMGALLLEGNLGKHDATLNLKTDEGRAALRRLVEDADILLDGYRPGALERLGFGVEYLHEIGRRRGKGIIVVRENCYGWNGPLAKRSGWQQISDCVTGVSWAMGKFLGLDEPVVPPLPNSDFQTGLAGLIGILTAVDKRATEGGNYTVSVALNQFNNFLLSLGPLGPDAQQTLRALHPNFKPRHHDDMLSLLGKCMATLQANTPSIFRPAYFGNIPSNFLAPDGRLETLTYLQSAARYEVSKLGYDVGSCLLGAYEPVWPGEKASL